LLPLMPRTPTGSKGLGLFDACPTPSAVDDVL
jgi:hypothetical protein